MSLPVIDVMTPRAVIYNSSFKMKPKHLNCVDVTKKQCLSFFVVFFVLISCVAVLLLISLGSVTFWKMQKWVQTSWLTAKPACKWVGQMCESMAWLPSLSCTGPASMLCQQVRVAADYLGHFDIIPIQRDWNEQSVCLQFEKKISVQ